MNLVGVAEEIQHRIIHIFGRDLEGRRATNGGNPKLDQDPYFRDYVWFYEVGQPFSLSFIVPEWTFVFSSSMQTAAKAWEHRIKQAGKGGK